jgi:hypothetical protein
VSLDEFIDSILGSVDDELESDIVIDVLLHGALERFTLDPRLTARALQNLLRNATRYCEKRIQVGVLVSDDGCEIWVDDDGIGIPDDERERVFEPFYRLDRSRDRATGGFGLGLAISRRAIEGQGGTLTVGQSALGGAQFKIRLAGEEAPEPSAPADNAFAGTPAPVACSCSGGATDRSFMLSVVGHGLSCSYSPAMRRFIHERSGDSSCCGRRLPTGRRYLCARPAGLSASP